MVGRWAESSTWSPSRGPTTFTAQSTITCRTVPPTHAQSCSRDQRYSCSGRINSEGPSADLLVSIYINPGRFWQQNLQILRSSRVGERGDNPLGLPAVGDTLRLSPIPDLDKSVIEQAVVDLALPQLRRQPVMSVEVDLQTARQPGGDTDVGQP